MTIGSMLMLDQINVIQKQVSIIMLPLEGDFSIVPIKIILILQVALLSFKEKIEAVKNKKIYYGNIGYRGEHNLHRISSKRSALPLRNFNGSVCNCSSVIKKEIPCRRVNRFS